MTAAQEAPRQPLNVECGKCQHRWPVAYYPMEAGLLARLIAKARCPNCGATSRHIFLAQGEPS